jgi:polysaccharide deacetylase 2 family uncharacterized protein YibQ
LRDEVNEPLGLGPKRNPRPSALGRGLSRVVLTLAALSAGVGGVWLWKRVDPERVSPLAVARIQADKTPVAAQPSPPAQVATAEVPSPPIAGGISTFSSGQQVEAASGVRVTRGGGGGPPDALIIDVPQALGVRLAPAPDPRLVEKSRYGLLPRIGADGSRPADVYARPDVEAVKLRGAPKIAIVVGGLGLDAASTKAAIARLPSAVSLGFAPYGADLPALVAAARESGHEILLQAPMEGFGAGIPGPHTLTVSATESDNRDALQWMMARFPGFVGVENYLGAKFTADKQAYAPVLAEISARGLIYLDDGSSPRSLTGDIAPGLTLRAARADIVIDANPSAEAIELALAKLESLARHQDGAIGVATALPLTLEHLAHWTSALESRGIALTPISALDARETIHSAGATP